MQTPKQSNRRHSSEIIIGKKMDLENKINKDLNFLNRNNKRNKAETQTLTY